MGFGLHPTPHLLAVMSFGLRPTPHHPAVVGFLIASTRRQLAQQFAHHNARRIARRIAHCFCLLTAILSVCGLQYSSNRLSDRSSLPLVDSDPIGMNSNMYLI